MDELRKMSDRELANTLREKRQRIVELQFQLPIRQVKNHREIRQVRKDAARILTIQKEKKLFAELSNEKKNDQKQDDK